ncbi:MAG: PilZ domain-containing protein [Pseudomonadota bacterium]
MDHPLSPFEANALSGWVDRDPVDGESYDARPHSSEMRGATPHQTLIRPAKLITTQGEFVCVVRDVSRTSVRIRLFHPIPEEPQMALQMPAGSIYELFPVRKENGEASFRFIDEIDLAKFISEASEHPKRGLRFALFLPVHISAQDRSWEGVIENLSQRGARFACEGSFAIDQAIRLVGAEGAESFTEVEAKIRWRRDDHYGVVFDDTFSLSDFARICVELQSPMLARE